MFGRQAGDAIDLLDAGVGSAAFGAALELGLFWLLDQGPRDVPAISEALGVAEPRCSAWLQLLQGLDLVVLGPDGYEPSTQARTHILDRYSQPTWALLAQEARERLTGLGNVPLRLRQPIDDTGATDDSPSYVALMLADQERARRFTRMLFEIHRELADELADMLPLPASGCLLDLGGGSGVVSMAALRKWPALRATVLDIAPVCVAGRELAAEHGMQHRLSYVAADLLRDPLPAPADVVLESDVGVYGLDLFRRVRAVLSEGGTYLIVDQFEPGGKRDKPTQRLAWAFAAALRSTGYSPPSLAAVLADLEEVGFRSTRVWPVPPIADSQSRLTEDLTVIEARP